VSFDVENAFTVLDRDQSLASRELLEQFAGSRYFVPAGSARDEMQVRHVLRAANASLVVEIPQASVATCWPGAVPR
jgi:ribosome-dependent ATPase